MTAVPIDNGIQGLTFALISDWATIFTLIFGGCCSNALTLEQLTRAYPQSGTLITFAQFLLASVHGLPRFLTFSRSRYVPLVPVPKLRKRKIPMTRYLLQVGLFYGISLLNNKAFGYRIPMPVHIIFRSGGLVVSMVMGWLFAGKRYNTIQIVSVFLVTIGVVLTTLSASSPKPRGSTTKSFSPDSVSTSQYATGIAILSFALVLSGALGLVQDRTYALYAEYSRAKEDTPTAIPGNGHPQPPENTAGRPAGTPHAHPNGKATSPLNAQNGRSPPQQFTSPKGQDREQDDDIPPWKESVFYLHFLSLPMFSFVRDDLAAQFSALSASPPLTVSFLALSPSLSASLSSSSAAPLLLHFPSALEKALSLVNAIPSGYIALALTTLTSLVCVNGVNRLTARVSSLTVTLILVIRKAVSMVVSVVLFGLKSGGESDPRMMWAGAGLVFLGTMGYAAGSARSSRRSAAEKTKKE